MKPIFEEVMNELKREENRKERRCYHHGQGFLRLQKLLGWGLSKYRIVTLIFSRNNFKLGRLDAQLLAGYIFSSKSLKKEKKKA
ncbi:hypothetical protein [Archaeoglobus sp.]